MIGKVTHHSIELSWMNEENKPRNGPPECWTRFSVEQMDPKTHTYSTVYMSVFSVWRWRLFLWILKLLCCNNNILVFYHRGYSTHHLVESLESSTSYNLDWGSPEPQGSAASAPWSLSSPNVRYFTVPPVKALLYYFLLLNLVNLMLLSAVIGRNTNL